MTSNPSIDLLRLINGYQISQAIHVVAALGIADHLKGGPASVERLAACTGADSGALYRLLRAVASIGVLRESVDRQFSLTAMGDCLRSDAAASFGPWAEFIGRPYHWQAWGHLLHSIRTGQNAFRAVHGMSVWQYRECHPDEGATFDRAMASNARALVAHLVTAYDFGQFGHVADIGGGKGETLLAILRAYPALRGTLFDQPHVTEKAMAALRSEAMASRCDIVGGSFFVSIPPDADVYLLRAIVHDWDDEQAIALLTVCRRAMAPNAKLVLVERVIGLPNEGALTTFSDLNMLASPGGRERSREEFAVLCGAAGFAVSRFVPAGPIQWIIEANPC